MAQPSSTNLAGLCHQNAIAGSIQPYPPRGISLVQFLRGLHGCRCQTDPGEYPQGYVWWHGGYRPSSYRRLPVHQLRPEAGANHLPQTVNGNGPPIPFGRPAAPIQHKIGPQKRKRSSHFWGLRKRNPNTRRQKPLTQMVKPATTGHDSIHPPTMKPFLNIQALQTSHTSSLQP